MCDKHLRGEHVETHMFVGSLKKGKSVKGFIADGLFDPSTLKARHDEIAEEMVRRGGKHESPLSEYVIPEFDQSYIDIHANLVELARRCPDCYDRVKFWCAGIELPFPRGGDKVFEHEERWWVQLTGQWLTGESYPNRTKALTALERMRREMTLRRQGRL
jgi:hypothetical protein